MHRFAFETMGTVASIATVREVTAAERSDLEAACAGFDERFSLYRDDSELSRVNRGELALTKTSEELREAYALAKQWSIETGGAFNSERPDGTLDLNGVVKALAIAGCAALLQDAGHPAGYLTIGGDGQAWGEPVPGEPWLAGVVDPANSQELIATTTLGPGRWALATSGSAERGDHIWSRPGVTPPLQASVLAPDIVTADVLATAIIAGGVEAMDDATMRWPIQVFVVMADGSLLATPEWNPAASA